MQSGRLKVTIDPPYTSDYRLTSLSVCVGGWFSAGVGKLRLIFVRDGSSPYYRDGKLVDRKGGVAETNLTGACFSDSATATFPAAAGPFNGTWLPQDPLMKFADDPHGVGATRDGAPPTTVSLKVCSPPRLPSPSPVLGPAPNPDRAPHSRCVHTATRTTSAR